MYKRWKDLIQGCLCITLWNQCWKIGKFLKAEYTLVVADNASNMKKALREGRFEAQGCFAHILQLIVNDGVLSQ